MDHHRPGGHRCARAHPRTRVDEDVLHRIVDASWTADSPYSDVETLVEKVGTLRRFLVGVARERACTDHGAVARRCTVHPARQHRVLQFLGLHEDQLDRPLLPAVVTPAGAETPDAEYFRLVERAPGQPDDVPSGAAERRWLWNTQRARVYREWAVADDTRAARGSVSADRTAGQS